MRKLGKMKKIILILSLFLTLPMACAVAPFPNERLYVVDLVNKVCAEYEVVDLHNVTFRWIRDLELLPGGPCDRMVGWSKDGFKKIQNWIRDAIKESEKR